MPDPTQSRERPPRPLPQDRHRLSADRGSGLCSDPDRASCLTPSPTLRRLNAAYNSPNVGVRPFLLRGVFPLFVRELHQTRPTPSHALRSRRHWIPAGLPFHVLLPSRRIAPSLAQPVQPVTDPPLRALISGEVVASAGELVGQALL